MSDEIKKITHDADPERCLHVLRHGQCTNKCAPGSDYCLAHGGNKAAQAEAANSLKNYKIHLFKERLGDLSNSDNITALHDEVALLRFMIEERIKQCASEGDLLLVSGPLSELIMKVEKVVTSCHKLENSLGKLLGRDRLIQFATEVIDIINDETKHLGLNAEETSNFLDAIGSRIEDAIKTEEVE